MNVSIDFLAIVSGPEPKRTILEKGLIKALTDRQEESLIVLGKPEINKEEKRGSLTDIGVVDPPTPDGAMFSDANLMILSNKNNPIVQVDFKDLFPVSLGQLEYNQNAADVEYIQVSAEFTYTLYEFRTL